MNHLATGEDLRTGWKTQLCDLSAVEFYWSNIVEMLKRVPDTWASTTLEALYNNAISGNMQVWLIGPKDKIVVVAFTHILNFPAARILEVIWLGGQGALDGLDVMDSTISEFARVQGCSRIDITGRRGWLPEAKRHGFREVATIFSRPVVHERRH